MYAPPHLHPPLNLPQKLPIAQDLARLEDPTLHISLGFQRGLHPFYPASLKLQGPRLQPGVLGALTSHPLLLIRHWAPFMPLAQLLQLLHAFLQASFLFCQLCTQPSI